MLDRSFAEGWAELRQLRSRHRTALGLREVLTAGQGAQARGEVGTPPQGVWRLWPLQREVQRGPAGEPGGNPAVTDSLQLTSLSVSRKQQATDTGVLWKLGGGACMQAGMGSGREETQVLRGTVQAHGWLLLPPPPSPGRLPSGEPHGHAALLWSPESFSKGLSSSELSWWALDLSNRHLLMVGDAISPYAGARRRPAPPWQ